jgi:hypothetical protein
MKRPMERLTITAGRKDPVPKGDTDRLKKAVQERVIKPIQKRAFEQRDFVTKVRARQVR